ncbi:hypothetical protein NBRC3299_0240 [Acetobacter pasteurianus NBRC 3299]|nr:hypothetical protein BBA71_02015 [Acetobacter pasteurianus]GCD73948.1 hypothetical protein NBRC3299_0240 [Acetobacter pasteurianus NBRC 3299]
MRPCNPLWTAGNIAASVGVGRAKQIAADHDDQLDQVFSYFAARLRENDERKQAVEKYCQTEQLPQCRKLQPVAHIPRTAADAFRPFFVLESVHRPSPFVRDGMNVR